MPVPLFVQAQLHF